MTTDVSLGSRGDTDLSVHDVVPLSSGSLKNFSCETLNRPLFSFLVRNVGPETGVVAHSGTRPGETTED